MKQAAEKNFARILLSALLLAVLLTAGCSNDQKEAENSVQAYLTAVSGFNLDAMETCLTEGKNEDFGIDTSMLSKNYVQTDTYKKAVDTMFKSLSATMEFSVNSSEKKTDDTMVVSTTIKYADVNEEAVEQFMQQKTDEYFKEHPELEKKTEIEQSDTGITVMANAYKEFLQTQGKISKDVDITVVRKDGKWKILNGEENSDLKNLLTDIYSTF